ncbi:hypothetical protein SRHO_G00177860 [Serrasalmus rhombeus]
MKILLIFTLHLISGAAAGTDVIGFLGGRVTINFKHSDYGRSEKSFCKMKTQTECEYIIVAEYEQRNTWIQKDRFELFDDSYKTIIVSIRQLSSEDAGTYQCGEAGSWSHQFNLRVIRAKIIVLQRKPEFNSLNTVSFSIFSPELKEVV